MIVAQSCAYIIKIRLPALAIDSSNITANLSMYFICMRVSVYNGDDEDLVYFKRGL